MFSHNLNLQERRKSLYPHVFVVFSEYLLKTRTEEKKNSESNMPQHKKLSN